MGETTSILTDGQRRYLRGEEEPAQERTTLTRLRERIRAGLQDFQLLSDRFPIGQFEETAKEHAIDVQIQDMVTVGFLLLDGDRSDHADTSSIERFEAVAEAGLTKALNRLGTAVEEIDVSIEVTEQDPEKDIGEMSIDEIGQRMRMGELDRTQAVERFIEELPEADGDSLSERWYDTRESRAEWMAEFFSPKDSDEE